MSGTAHGSAQARPGSCTLVGQQRRPVGDVEQARGVLGALDVARHPVELVGGAGRACVRRRRSSVASTQVSFVPPPCDELTTSEPSRSATRVRPPGHQLTRLARTARRAAGRCAAARCPLRRTSGTSTAQASAGRCTCRAPRGCAARNASRSAARRGGPDQHPVAARAVHFLDDQLGQMREHVVAVVGLAAADTSARCCRIGSSAR